MNASEVIKNLTELMMMADNEKSFVTLNEALKLISEKEQHQVSVPCRIGDRLYSIVGEKVHAYVITGFRIEREMVYMESQESMLFREDKVGIYYFWSHDLAQREFDKKRRKKESF